MRYRAIEHVAVGQQGARPGPTRGGGGAQTGRGNAEAGRVGPMGGCGGRVAWDWDRRGSRSGGTDGDDGGIEVPDPLGRVNRVQAEMKLQWLVLDPMCRGHRGGGGVW